MTTKGQGVGGTWYASAPDGKKAWRGCEGGGAAAAGSGADLPALSTRNDPKLGEIVVDKNGMTVYRFAKDSAWPMKSTASASAWRSGRSSRRSTPTTPRASTQEGLAIRLRPARRPKQQTIDCWPIYTFAGDKKPGDTNGQGVGGTWYAITGGQAARRAEVGRSSRSEE